MKRPKVNRSKRGLDVVSSLDGVTRWIDADLAQASPKQVEALRDVAVGLFKVARYEARVSDYAQAHNDMRAWVCSLPDVGGKAQAMPREAAELVQSPPSAPMDRHRLFGVFVQMMRSGGFSFRICAEVLDDGWGGDVAARTKRAMQQAAAARRGGEAYVRDMVSDLVKGECPTCATGPNHPR